MSVLSQQDVSDGVIHTRAKFIFLRSRGLKLSAKCWRVCLLKGFAHRGQIGLLILIRRVEKCTPPKSFYRALIQLHGQSLYDLMSSNQRDTNIQTTADTKRGKI